MSTTTDFSTVLRELQDTTRPFSMASLYYLSDLSRQDLDALEAVWPDIAPERRYNIVQNLSDISDANFEVSFEAVFRLALEDESPDVRANAIRALWESEDPKLIAPLLDFLQHDPEQIVRSAAASALGRYVYLGELDELPSNAAHRVEDALLDVIRGSDELEVRRRALEAVAFSSRPEVSPLISEAYASAEPRLRISAVFAMGRSADSKRWGTQVLSELQSGEPEMRFEAARAAGELELREAAPQLADLIEDVDVQVQEAAIWSLGQVGGDFARRTLTQLLDQTEDDDDRDFIEEAIDNLSFTDEVHAFTLFEVDEDDDGAEALLDDFEEEDDLDEDDFDLDGDDEEDEGDL